MITAGKSALGRLGRLGSSLLMTAAPFSSMDNSDMIPVQPSKSVDTTTWNTNKLVTFLRNEDGRALNQLSMLFSIGFVMIIAAKAAKYAPMPTWARVWRAKLDRTIVWIGMAVSLIMYHLCSLRSFEDLTFWTDGVIADVHGSYVHYVPVKHVAAPAAFHTAKGRKDSQEISDSIDGVRLNSANKAPDEKAMLLFHGFGANSLSWGAFQEAFQPCVRGIHSIAIDTKGFGMSPRRSSRLQTGGDSDPASDMYPRRYLPIWTAFAGLHVVSQYIAQRAFMRQAGRTASIDSSATVSADDACRVPSVIMGHSMGCVPALIAAAKAVNDLIRIESDADHSSKAPDDVIVILEAPALLGILNAARNDGRGQSTDGKPRAREILGYVRDAVNSCASRKLLSESSQQTHDTQYDLTNILKVTGNTVKAMYKLLVYLVTLPLRLLVVTLLRSNFFWTFGLQASRPKKRTTSPGSSNAVNVFKPTRDGVSNVNTVSKTPIPGCERTSLPFQTIQKETQNRNNVGSDSLLYIYRYKLAAYVNGFLDDFMKFVSAQSLALRGGIGEGAFGSSVILSSEQKQKFTETGNGKETPGMFQYNDNTTIHAINRSASRDDLLQKPLQITSWSLIRALVDSGKCRIAIVHGTEDPIVPYTSSVGLFEALLNTIRDDRRGRNPMTERDAEKEIHDIYAERGSTHGQNDDDSVPHNRRPEGSIRLYEIPHIGHTPHEECPEAFTHIINDIIHDWLIPT